MRGVAYGLVAAALFGVSAPVAKVLLPAIDPLVLAGLLYLGGGLALSIAPRRGPREPPIGRADAAPLVAIALLGGVAGPLLMLAGLARTTAVAGSLLLNLEAPFTIALAVTVFREHLGRRELAGAAVIVAGALVLAAGPGEVSADAWGAIAIAGACLAWAVDNNLTQRLSARDPVQVVRAKALGAGTATLALAVVLGRPVPAGHVAATALVVGAFSYGLSLLFDLKALRIHGAAREAAVFATAPFLGALAAVPIAGERISSGTLAAGLVMAVGVALLVRARHGHPHAHEPLAHDHLHVHDEHHRHPHDGPDVEPHSHPHAHAPLVHDHPHVSDSHHRHGHS